MDYKNIQILRNKTNKGKIKGSFPLRLIKQMGKSKNYI